MAMFDSQPLATNLSGLGCEYRILQLYARDAGLREAKLMFDVGQGTQVWLAGCLASWLRDLPPAPRPPPACRTSAFATRSTCSSTCSRAST